MDRNFIYKVFVQCYMNNEMDKITIREKLDNCELILNDIELTDDWLRFNYESSEVNYDAYSSDIEYLMDFVQTDLVKAHGIRKANISVETLLQLDN